MYVGNFGANIGIGQADASVNDILTEFVRMEAQINQFVTKQVYGADALLMAAGGTKRMFPAGTGDTLRDQVLTTTVPTSAAGQNWTRINQAMPGGPIPSRNEPELIRYGSYAVTGCLYKKSYKTHEFNVVDMTFQQHRNEQFSNLMKLLPAWSLGVEKQWYRAAFRANVPCMVLNEQAGNPTNVGSYTSTVKPTSFLTPEYMDEIYIRLQGKGATINPFAVVDGAAVLVAFIGPEEFRMIDYLDKKKNSGLGSRQMSVALEKLGNVRVIDNWVYIRMDYPTRLTDTTAGGYVEVESHDERAVQYGYESVENPEYRDPEIAKYVETILWHQDATHWLKAPDFTGWGNMQFGMQDFSGNFKFIAFPTKEDPLMANGYFLAQYQNGMMPHFPERGMCVLSRAVHLRGRDLAECYLSGTAANNPLDSMTLHPIRNRTFALVPNVAGAFTFNTKEALTACGSGYQLYAVSQGGVKAAITLTYTNVAGYYKVYIATFNDTALGVERPCDPWVSIGCLPTGTPEEASAADCLACSGDANGADNTDPVVCDYAATLEAEDGITNIRLGGRNLSEDTDNFDFPYAVADVADLETDLNAAIAALGGNAGTVFDVAVADDVWTITATGSDLPLQAAYSATGVNPFIRTNCHAPGSGEA